MMMFLTPTDLYYRFIFFLHSLIKNTTELSCFDFEIDVSFKALTEHHESNKISAGGLSAEARECSKIAFCP